MPVDEVLAAGRLVARARAALMGGSPEVWGGAGSADDQGGVAHARGRRCDD